MASVNLFIDWRLPKTGKVSEIFRGREFTAESEKFSLLFYFCYKCCQIYRKNHDCLLLACVDIVPRTSRHINLYLGAAENCFHFLSEIVIE